MEYGTGNDDAVFRKVGSSKKKAWVAGVVAGVLLLVCYFQKDKIVDFILPGDPNTTKKAIRVFVGELKGGEGVVDAFGAFCKVIVDEASIS